MKRINFGVAPRHRITLPLIIFLYQHSSKSFIPCLRADTALNCACIHKDVFFILIYLVIYFPSYNLNVYIRALMSFREPGYNTRAQQTTVSLDVSSLNQSVTPETEIKRQHARVFFLNRLMFGYSGVISSSNSEALKLYKHIFLSLQVCSVY